MYYNDCFLLLWLSIAVETVNVKQILFLLIPVLAACHYIITRAIVLWRSLFFMPPLPILRAFRCIMFLTGPSICPCVHAHHLHAVPRFQLNTYGRRAFSVAGLMACNSLPDFIQDATRSTDCFRCLLKTYLFARY